MEHDHPSNAVEPWQSEFRVNEEVVRAVLRSQFPALVAESLEYVHEGWDSEAYLVNGEWIFKFPKRRERQNWLLSEVAVLGLLGSKGLEIEIPIPEYLGQPGPLFPCGFVGYRRIGGIPGDCMMTSRIAREDSARKLGTFLTTLHSVDVGEVEALGVQRYDCTLESRLAESVTMRETIVPHLSSELEEVCRPFLDGTARIPDVPKPTYCLVHGDLADQHILLNDDGSVTGIIDWGDSCLSRRASDFSGLYAWLGEDFVQSVLGYYRVPRDASFLEQIRFQGRCLALVTYGHSLKGHDTSQAERMQMVHTAFGTNHA